MARFTEVVLDGETYKVPTLSNDQLERIMDIMTDEAMPQHKRAFKVLPIAMEDAEPKPDKIRATSAEMADALAKVFEAAGLKEPAANPPALAVVKTGGQ